MTKTAIEKKRAAIVKPSDFATLRDNCVAANIGKAHRIVARIYEDAFREIGVSAPQFAVLVSLMVAPGSSAGDLADALSADPSTVSRNTELLIQRDLIRMEPGADRRVRTYFLTAHGEAAVRRGVPRWKSAQRTALHRIGRAQWRFIRRALRALDSHD